MSDDRYIWDLLKNGEYRAVMASCPVDFDFKNPPDRCPPLIRVAYNAFSKDMSRDAEPPDAIKMLQWLLDRGEDPAEVAPRTCTFSMDKYYTRAGGDEDQGTRDQSAVSYLLMAKRLMKAAAKENVKNPEMRKYDWKHDIERIDEVLPLLYAACGRGRPAAREKIPIDAAIVHRWSKLLHDASSHDVTLQTDDGDVGAHVAILALASPVLDRMLSTAMVEGRTKRVAVRDTPKAAMDSSSRSCTPAA